ncbi:complement C1s subcomponent-like isoform X2 [Rhinoraja longicauda]
MSEGSELARLCGRRDGSEGDPGLYEYYSGTNSMGIAFRANTSGIRPFSGFLALYSRVGSDVVCPRRVPAHGAVSPLWKQFRVKDRAKVACQPGYEIVEGYKTIPHYFIECQPDGTWSESRHKCLPVECGSPPNIDNGRFIFPTGAGNTTYSSQVQYQCDQPYYHMDQGNQPYYHMGQGNQRNFSCTETGTWENEETGPVVPHCAPVCGYPSRPLPPQERVLRGREAAAGNFPWQVLFQGRRGAGALVGDRWVLTAAHVVSGTGKLQLVAGLTDLWEMDRGTRLRPRRVFVHPDYRHDPDIGSERNYDHDIALVQIDGRVAFGPLLSPVCLPSADSRSQLVANKLGLVSGWGVTENNTLPSRLMYARIPLRQLAECRRMLAGQPVHISRNMLCAGGGDGGSDSCQGDSGGAMVFPSARPHQRRLFVGGIVSWGVGCGTVGFYTKVDNYLDWIHQVMDNN